MELINRKPNRIKNYDYSLSGFYSVTMCSKDRANIFIEMGNDVGTWFTPVRRFELSKIGQIIDRQWNEIKKRYNHVNLDEYIIMPNHIHGIIIINKRTGVNPVPTLSNIIGSFKFLCSNKYLEYIKENHLDLSS